jgi:hypothetical protein
MRDKFGEFIDFMEDVFGILVVIGIGILVTRNVGTLEGAIAMSCIGFLLMKDWRSRRNHGTAKKV